MKSSKVTQLAYAALGACLIAILAQLTIPFPIVPNTAQPLALGLVATIFGKKVGTMATVTYVVMGAFGLPVFAGMSSGLGVILGPTGGYILFFPIMVFLIGLAMEKVKGLPMAIIANIVLTIALITVGTWRMSMVVEIPFTMALASGFMPFIITNPIQAFIAANLGYRLRRQLHLDIKLSRTKPNKLDNLVEA